MSAKIDFLLNPDSRLDGKWLKTDLEVALHKNNVVHYWNELLKDGELVIHGYCSSKASTPDSDNCGLGNDIDGGLYSKKTKSDLTNVLLGQTASQKLLDSWTWSKNIDIKNITQCFKLLQKEQQLLCGVVSGNTISSCRLQQRVVVAYRYFLALRKQTDYQLADHDRVWNDIVNTENNNLLDHTFELDNTDNTLTDSVVEEQNSIYGLARIGTRTALNFAFAFLRRAWRSGEDCDICSELLQETLDALRALPEALLFKERKMLSVWIDILEKSSAFLQQVVLCEVISSSEREIPLVDRQYALQILFELAIQKGTITAMLDMVLILLTLSEKNDRISVHKPDKEENSFPLVPFLKRFQQVLRSTFQRLNGYDIWLEKDGDDIATCPTECFLRFLEFPSDDNVVIDLKVAAVIIMAYLNRLIIPYLPTAAFLDNKKLNQMVFAWGWLPWESRNKSSLCQTIGELGVVKIVLSDKYLFFISFEKKLYSYNYIGDPQEVEVVNGLNDKNIIDVVAHPEGRHYMALSTEGSVYSWGNGEGGRLGHGDNNSQEYPTLIEALLGHTVVRIACGSTYSAAITAQGELFTWGRGNYGRLGHGTNDDANIPLLVEALKSFRIIDVACGCGDAQTLAVTDTGMVYSWGDGDYGKLGRGGSEASKIPKLIESLCHVRVNRVYCGAQFSVALTSDGEVYTWGKGDHYRLGHGSEEHLRFPKKVNGLKGMKVKKLAVGVTHVIALLENGDIYGWGKKEYAHPAESDAAGAVPELVANVRANNIAGVACGVTQSFAWSTPNHSKIGVRVPFITDISKNSVNKLNKLLVTVCNGVTTISDRPPSQDKECLIVSTFNILQLQLHAISVNNVDVDEIDLYVGSPLLSSIKQIVVDVASTSGVLDTIQSAAQATLQVGWNILLPTAEERAKALCSLMPASDWNCNNLSQGQHFMTDLLVSSLMADGGLEISLQAAMKMEMSESIREDCCSNSASNFSPIPLLQLIKQLLRNCLSQTLSGLQLLKPIQSTNERSPSLVLLIRFQRLLIAQIYQNKASESQYSWECDERNIGAESLFRKYLQYLINYVCQVLITASEVASRSNKHFYTVCNILKNTGVEILLPELLICLIMLHEEVPLLLHTIDWLELFGPLFNALEQFNKITPHLEKEEDDEMSWAGVSVNCNSSAHKNSEDMPSVRKADVENHNRDGGFWIVYNNKVYDIQDSDIPGEMENLRKYFKGELSVKSEDLLTPSPELLQSCCVGNYIDPDEDVSQPLEISYSSSPLLDAQRTLSYLLGFHARCLSIGIPVLQTEKDMAEWLSAPFLKGGLTPLSPYEEKDEARITSTTPTEPPVTSACPYTSNFENSIKESKIWDTVSAFDAYLTQNFKHQALISFNLTHPVEEVNRMLLAVFIKHLALGPSVVECLRDGNRKYNEYFEIIANVLHKTKLKLIQMKQEQDQSYKELCVPFLNKCRFLLDEVRPATSHEVNAINGLRFLYTETRLKKTAKYVINCVKNQKRFQDGAKHSGKKLKEHFDEKLYDKEKKTNAFDAKVNVKPGKTELIHAIVRFVIEESTADIELIRKAMCVQVERCCIRKQGYDLMLKLLTLPTVAASVKYSVINGWLVTLPIITTNENSIMDTVVTPHDKMELLFAKYKILQWTLHKLHKAVMQADRTFKFCASKDKNGCFSQRKLCWIRLVLSMIGLLSETANGNELSFVINSGLFANMEYIFRDTDIESSNKSFYGNNFNVVAIFDDEQSGTRSNYCNQKSNAPFVSSGPGVVPYLKPGVRIVRGPNWKWGDQDGPPPGEGTVISTVSDDGWVPVKWDTGSRNAYRMGKDGKYDLQLAPSGNDLMDRSPDTEEENIKDSESEKTKLRNPNDVLKRASVGLLKIISLATGLYSDDMQESSLRKMSHYLRFNLQEMNKKKLTLSDHNRKIQRDWVTLGFLRTIARTKGICSALCAPSWLLLLFNMASGQNVGYHVSITMQLQALRLLQTILPVGLNDTSSFPLVIKKLFHLLGKIALFCYPDLPMYNFVEGKPVVSLTASSTSTIVEEFVVLMRKLHTTPGWIDAFNSLIISKLATAADLLSHPLLVVENDNEREVSEALCSSLASLLIFGGLDSRPRLGGTVLQGGHRMGTICNIFSKSGLVMVQFHETNKTEQLALKPLKPLPSIQFQVDNVPVSDSFLDTWATLISMASLIYTKKSRYVSVNVPLLRNQQQTFSVISAGRVLLNYQSRLRKVLKRPTLELHVSLEDLNETGDIGDVRQSLLIHQLILNAVQATPLKPIFSRKELEEAAINISQYLAVDVYAKRENESNTRINNKRVDATARCPSPPATPLVAQLMEMGFSRKAVEIALKATNEMSESSASIEQLVAWLLEYSDEYHLVDECLTSLESNDRESGNKPKTSVVPRCPITIYKKRSDFASADEYATYVRNNCAIGMSVRCCRSYEEEVYEGDTGVVVKINNGELHDLNLQVDWHMKGYAYWVRFIHVELLGNLNSIPTIKVGDTVRVKPSVVTPQFKWGSITHNSVGIVTAVSKSGQQITVDFPQQAHWIGSVSEMEILPPHHQEISCNYCFTRPIVGARFKCKVCENYNMCENCFYTPYHHPHNFVRINEPGSAAIFAGKPRKVERHGIFTVLETDIIEDNFACIKKLSTSSRENWADHLLDLYTDNYWQSCGSHGRHWIRLEMNPNICVYSLKIKVDPNDTTYMPSLIKVFGGDNFYSLAQLSAVIIHPRDTVVTLLTDVQEYYPCIEISIKMCHKGGIDCKIHALYVTGKKRSCLDLPSTASFMASDYNDIQDMIDFKNHVISYENKVYVWGLNDKEQLGGGFKGSKVRVPQLSESISALRPLHIAGGSKSLFIVSWNGKVFACGETTNGRLGLGTTLSDPNPRQIKALNPYIVKKVAVHSGGRHAMALTLSGKVFSWGLGDDGRLGHGNTQTLNEPKMIEYFKDKRIKEIACGSSYSAAITSSGELYTWGLGEYGRLGHGDSVTHYKPKLVRALIGKHMVKVACGSRDAQTLALDNEGMVYSWGDGDFGKLGRGGSESCDIPYNIESLNGKGVIHIDCGAQFSLALTKAGEIWTWGKGDYCRLGLGNDQLHIRRPTLVAGLKGVHIVDVAAGALHCLAVSSPGVVFAWGDNDHGQQGNCTLTPNPKPTAISTFFEHRVNRVACGSSHAVAWQAYEPACRIAEPIQFEALNDPLGADMLDCNGGKKEEFEEVYDNDEEETVNLTKRRPPSLSKQILSLESNVAKQTALHHVLNSLRVMYARDAVVAALSSCINTEITDEKQADEMIASTSNVLSESSMSVIAQGGGEAPAAHVESDELASSSNITTPEEIENPLNAFQSITSSESASYHMSVSRMSASTMSMIAATLKSNSQILGVTDTDIMNPSVLDDFTGLLGPNDARILMDLLKFAVAGRMSDNAKETISNVLKTLASKDSCIAAIILEICISELEDVAINSNILHASPLPVAQESLHPYGNQILTHGVVKIPGAECLRIEFDSKCSTEKNRDSLTLYDPFRMVVYVLSGREASDWPNNLYIPGEEVRWKFIKDMKNNGWGWKFIAHPIMGKKRYGSDRDILSNPSIQVVISLLNSSLTVEPHEGLVQRLVGALASCAQLSTLEGKEKMWCLDKIVEFLKSPLKKMLHLPKFSQDVLDSPLTTLMKALPRILFKQFEYEDHFVKRGKQLLYSSFFKSVAAVACELEIDAQPLFGETGKWAWFKHYCIARRVADALIHRTAIPKAFCLEVRKVIEHDPSFTCFNNEFSYDYENNELFTREHDEQLLMWLNRKPENWNLSWSGSGVIYGWGHNHRGQLGGVAGNQVKIPTPCEALTSLRPVQLAGGEQSLFAITSEGRVYATGFADKGRLGIGDISHLNQANPYINTPMLIEPLSKIAVHSGGKHCLALANNGHVFAWGDGEDGKLGLGHKNSCYSPTLIDFFKDKDIVEIACGGAHSAAVTRSGKLYTWGRGRYGRLGHGTGDDECIPRLVEILLGYQVIDVACGSGDAQTLCITSDDNVWSWGDGDYGKLGRGGADGCSIPLKIESLAGLGVVKVECGSQFSVALTRSGSVYTWGKGDYFRLGHGNEEHVRRPKKVAGLQGKKIASIATGSLHVVVCTNKGEVFAWGDNDEGQIGDGTLKAVPKPRAIPALQDRNISFVVCGSAHTFAKSSDKPASRIHNMPAQVPLEYDLLRDLPLPLIRNRLVLLHYFSDLFAPVVNMFPLEGDISLDKLRGILVYSAKESIFRKILNTTMAKEPHHGPTIELNRIQVKKSRVKGGCAGPDGIRSVFGQMVQKSCLTKESLMLPHRVWKVQFVGESVDDYGGGYSESIAEMCEELQNGSLPLLIPTPNGRDDTGTNRDCFIFNPTVKSPLHLEMFNFLGVLMGIAIRTGSPLSLNLAEPVWKQIAGMPLTVADITEIDRDYIPGLLFIRDMNPDDKSFLDIPFSTTSASGQEISLSSTHRKVTPSNRQEFIKLALNYRLHEFDEQVNAVRAGLAKVVPVPLLSLFTGYELETMVCGSPDIPLDLLKSVAVYKGVLLTDDLVEWFWEVMEEFSNQERSLFLRFVWGRTRLPRTIADFRGRDFVLQVMDKYNPPDHFLPESYTCFFLLKMPRYSNKFVLREKLKYAIYFCKSIDTDEYARIAIPGTGLTSSNSDSDGLESITGDETTPT